MRVRRALATGMVCTLAAGTVPAAAQAQIFPEPTSAAAAAAARQWIPAPTVAPVLAAAPIPKPGASGSHVTALQRALIARGHGIPAGATGYFGSQTRAAVASFQRAQGWSGPGADGIPGPQTMARLGLTGTPSAPAPRPAPAPAPAPVKTVSTAIPKPGASGSHVTALQRALIARGHGIPAGATGYFGSQTRAAVASFQRAQGWSGSGADGIPGPQTMARLGLTGSTPTSTTSASSTPAPSVALTPSAFVARYAPLARQASASTGVPALVTLAQAALESGWGRSAVGYNFFGIKALPSDPAHTKRLRVTTEVFSSPNVTGYDVISIQPLSGGLYRYTVREYFRVYSSAEEAFRAHNVLLASSSRYRAAFQYTGDPYRFAAAVAAGGYATDPSYTSKLHDVMRLIQRYL